MYAPEAAAVATPIGLVVIEGDADRLTRIRLVPVGKPASADGAALREAADQITAWFAGQLTHFDLPLAPAATLRGEALRTAIRGIEHGQTVSYGELADAARSSARAIGQACARNPFPLVIPCHRVLRTGGVLGPYSAGDGPATKRWLLDFERRCRVS